MAVDPFASYYGTLTAAFPCRGRSTVVVGIFLLWLSVAASAADLVAESRRYQQAWSPDKVEFILAIDSAVTHVKAAGARSADLDLATVAAATRDALSAYASAVGLPISFIHSGAPCVDGIVTARVVITAPAREPSAEERKPGAGTSVMLPINVRSTDDCGYRRDAYTKAVALDLSDGARYETGEVVLGQAIAAFSRDLVDEVLLVWHPDWKLPEPGSRAFAVFSVEPLNPSATMGFLKGLFSGSSRRGLNGLGVTRIETAEPEFRWSSLDDLFSAQRPSDSGQRISDVTYDFRLYTAREMGLGLIPGTLLLERTRLVHPALQLPAPLEACQTYFWTVRARFRLAGFPRATEWMSMHNALGGVVAPWRFRRGESVWNAWNPALTYAAFATPSATGRKDCGR